MRAVVRLLCLHCSLNATTSCAICRALLIWGEGSLSRMSFDVTSMKADKKSVSKNCTTAIGLSPDDITRAWPVSSISKVSSVSGKTAATSLCNICCSIHLFRVILWSPFGNCIPSLSSALNCSSQGAHGIGSVVQMCKNISNVSALAFVVAISATSSRQVCFVTSDVHAPQSVIFFSI